MRRLQFVCLFAVSMVIVPTVAFGQDCRFSIRNDESLRDALNRFHGVLAELVHGPAAQGSLEAARARMEELPKLRDAIMAANLPEKLVERCAQISAGALDLSNAVDAFVSRCQGNGDKESMMSALDQMHSAYRNLNHLMTSSEDLIRAFHDLLHPLWHQAYPDKDTGAIKAEIPRLKVRAKLILRTVENDGRNLSGAEALLEAVTTLEEAAAAEDDLATLEALRLVHDTYERLANP